VVDRALDGFRGWIAGRLIRSLEARVDGSPEPERLRMQRMASRLARGASRAEARLASASADAARPFPTLPPRTEWKWRPELWDRALSGAHLAPARTGETLAEGITVHHDCALGETIIRQVADDPSLQIDGLGFSGEYFSISIALPATLPGKLAASFRQAEHSPWTKHREADSGH